MNGITLRSFGPADISRVRGMFCRAFELDCYSNSRFVMRHLLDHYLCSYLREADYAIAACANGEVTGFLLGCGKRRRGKGIYALLRAYHRLFLPFSRGGRAYLHCKRLIDQADESLKAAAPEADGELMLFVVRPEERNRGTGRKMLQAFREWLAKQGALTMQLFTDDYCDVDYYRTRGYEQLGVRHIEFMPGRKSAFYLFSISVERIGESGK